MAKVAARTKSFVPKLQSTGSSLKKVTRAQVFHLVRRLCVLAAAILYVLVSFWSTLRALEVLQGATSPLAVYRNYSAALITEYVGSSTIRESKLVRMLDGSSSTLPRNDTLYLESATKTSFTGCSTAAKFNAKIYGNDFLRYGFKSLVTDGAYNLTFLGDHELILPIVDCSFTPLVVNDQTCARVFYLTRLKSNPAQVYIVTLSMAVLNYAVLEQHDQGAALLATFTFVDDMRTKTNVQHYFAMAIGYPYQIVPSFEIYEYLGETEDARLTLQSIPRDPTLTPSKLVHTARQRGFYIKSPTDQSNIKSMYWPLATDPVTIMRSWIWQGKTRLRDSWAWVHYIHAIFALNTSFNLCVLFLIMYRNFRLGKIWIGDAFASVSNTLMYRGTLVLLTWVFNGLWMISEICFAYGFEFADLPPLYIYPEMPQADIMTLYLCMVDLLGYLLKERIDPAFAMFAVEIGFTYRVEFGNLLLPPAFKQYCIDRSTYVHESGLAAINDYFTTISPLRLWTASQLPKNNLLLISASFSALFVIFFLIAVGYVVARRMYKRNHPENVYSNSNSAKPAVTERSSNEDSLSPKRTLTLFEVATGAELQNRFGVIADYDNFVYFKGLKFASADGIYCNGFVIANGKFLIATEDILAIIAMKLLRLRFRNVYTYEVDGSKLKQTAQLVYPETLSWHDLLHPNVSILA